MPCCYMLIFPNGKRYIGISRFNEPLRRFRSHLNSIRNSSRPVHNAIRKYGADNIVIFTMAVHKNYNLMKHLERLYILHYDTILPKGYNLTLGGDGTLGHKFTTEQLVRLSEAHKGIPSPKKGKPLSLEHRKKLSESHKGLRYPVRKKWSEESRKRQSEAQKKRFQEQGHPGFSQESRQRISHSIAKVWEQRRNGM